MQRQILIRLLANQFSSVFTKESNTEWDKPDPVKASNGIWVPFSENVVLKKLQNLSINKFLGPDDIISRIFVELLKCFASSLSVLLQTSYDTGIVPWDCKRAKITSIRKKDGKNDPKSYYVVSLTSI